MDGFDLISTAFLTIALGGLGTLVWGRLSRIEDNLEKLTATVATMVTRDEFLASRAEMLGMFESFAVAVRGELNAVRSELAGVRGELAQQRREIREDLGYLRSDLTAVALMVAPERRKPPKASRSAWSRGALDLEPQGCADVAPERHGGAVERDGDAA